MMSEDIAIIDMEISDDSNIEFESDEVNSGTDDYEKLKNLPRLNGEPIVGDVSERDPTVPDWAKNPEKPHYTAEELGAVNSADAITLEELDKIFNGL